MRRRVIGLVFPRKMRFLALIHCQQYTLQSRRVVCNHYTYQLTGISAIILGHRFLNSMETGPLDFQAALRFVRLPLRI